MKSIYLIKIVPFLFLSLIISSCSESYNLQTDNYEEALVVEATITNELKNQEIKLTKTSKFEEEEIKTVAGANVNIHDNKGNIFYFKESAGKYISETKFRPSPNTEYTLEIATTDGKKYQSSNETLTTETEIESVTPEVITDIKEGRGVQINVKSYDPVNTSKYYRYEYEEAYKIITPKWYPIKLVVIGPREVEEVLNETNKKICYTVKNSTDILQYTTTNLLEDRVDFPIRFISDQNYIISHRYSILVRQYVQNIESYTFYKTLKEISSSGSVLSPKQPGFLNGNIKCMSDSNSKVIGFFDVSAVSSKRVFFNYKDLFPGEPLPPYYTDCSNQFFNYCWGAGDPPCVGGTLIYNLTINSLTLINIEPKYIMVNAPCGDCTVFSSNVVPPFWTD
ncbi:DUF4249 domain-containing protein [Flavobacterium taihuense]|uniref:DUF4249 domain-containing protein n=1 Tax=Flavobacterium taihuense TaxID=2857508 RepID=A0ABS6XST8_9FLAO|nr:DUF4249 domain-containing protein [Flavobacterium taihuense]MBW4359743.1 DUF4249 domain-containing protein [Flavobacterium taihuense]